MRRNIQEPTWRITILLWLPLLGACGGAPSDNTPDTFLDSHFESEAGWVAAADEVRRSWTLAAGAESRIPVRVQSGSCLIADVTTVPEDRPRGAATRFEVLAERSGGAAELVFAEALSATSLTRAWKPISVDLGATGTEPLTLVIRTVTVGRGVGPSIALANPAIVSGSVNSEKPNLILIVVDTLRADRLGAYGHDRETSPFIDGLAERGVLYERVVAQSSWTKTSVPSMLTSTYPETHGVRRVDDRLSERFPTLAETLRSAGYFTVAIQTNPWLRTESGAARGFMEYAQPGWEGGAARVNELAIDALSRRPHRPFFLYLHYMDVHAPYTPPDEYRQFGPEAIDLYDAEIRQLDDQLAELHAILAKRGLLENTLIALTSDHGEEFEEHGGRFHGDTLYEEQIRVPWIMTWERHLPTGLRLPSLVRNLDLAPTLLALLDVPIPAEFQGLALFDSAAARVDYEDLPAFSQVGLNDVAPQSDLLALTTSHWKAIIDRISNRQELYDLRSDPFERADRSESDGETLSELKRTITEFLEASSAGPNEERMPLDPEVEERLRSLGYLQ